MKSFLTRILLPSYINRNYIITLAALSALAADVPQRLTELSPEMKKNGFQLTAESAQIDYKSLGILPQDIFRVPSDPPLAFTPDNERTKEKEHFTSAYFQGGKASIKTSDGIMYQFNVTDSKIVCTLGTNSYSFPRAKGSIADKIGGIPEGEFTGQGSFAYDPLNRPTHAARSQFRNDDQNGFVIKKEVPYGSLSLLVSDMNRDGFIDGGAFVEQFTYDAVGRRTSYRLTPLRTFTDALKEGFSISLNDHAKQQ